eukprot:5875532-Prymnesium_polylepis.1
MVGRDCTQPLLSKATDEFSHTLLSKAMDDLVNRYLRRTIRRRRVQKSHPFYIPWTRYRRTDSQETIFTVALPLACSLTCA